MKKLNIINIRLVGLVLIICIFCLVGCKKEGNKKETEAIVTVNPSTILNGTDFETAVYRYTTDKEGPKIAIVGGIHGDEVAGWNAGLRLVESLKTEKGICGEVLLIPQANILADNAKTRYSVSGYALTDLNRSFPLERYANASAQTISISTAILNIIEEFDPQYIIDLHESQHSWTAMESGVLTSLGDTIIASNNSKFIRKLLNRFNKVYKDANDTDFRQEGSNQKGSFNYYFTNTYSDKIVFTIETNRMRVNNVDNRDLNIRIEQQLGVLQALFDYAWNRI